MKIRKIIAGALVVIGAVLIFLAPDIKSGLALVALGIVVESVGIWAEKKR